jgi:hypothetical protein
VHCYVHGAYCWRVCVSDCVFVGVSCRASLEDSAHVSLQIRSYFKHISSYRYGIPFLLYSLSLGRSFSPLSLYLSLSWCVTMKQHTLTVNCSSL